MHNSNLVFTMLRGNKSYMCVLPQEGMCSGGGGSLIKKIMHRVFILLNN